jgi:hypothetical protein
VWLQQSIEGMRNRNLINTVDWENKPLLVRTLALTTNE